MWWKTKGKKGKDVDVICPICFFKKVMAADPDAALQSAMAFGETCGVMLKDSSYGVALAQLSCKEHGLEYCRDAMKRAIEFQKPLEDELVKRGSIAAKDVKTIRAAIDAAFAKKDKDPDERPN